MRKKENPFLSLVFNLVIPTLILTKLSSPDKLGQITALIVAVMFPLSYGIFDIIKTKKINKISILGLISIFLTGVVGVFKLPPQLIAIKEAAVPAIIGIAVLITAKTKNPLTKMFLMNDSVIEVEKVENRLKELDNEKEFEKKLYNSTFLLAFSFLVSSILNFVLAKVIVVSTPGTEEFNKEIGRMLAYSYPVIVLPSMIIMGFTLWYLFSNLIKLTNFKLEEMMINNKKEESNGK